MQEMHVCSHNLGLPHGCVWGECVPHVDLCWPFRLQKCTFVGLFAPTVLEMIRNHFLSFFSPLQALACWFLTTVGHLPLAGTIGHSPRRAQGSQAPRKPLLNEQTGKAG